MNAIVEKVIAGDVRTVARLIRDIDDGMPQVREILKELYPYTGKAYVIGITGAPGVGKSTLVDQMLSHLRKRNKTVGVLAVDPTSPFSGGAILGDRVRMQRHSMDEGIFIRSLATRGHFGGLTQSTRSAIDVLDAMGKDYILVETVGVGQDEVDVVRSAHTTIVMVIPGMGDGIHREGTEKTLADLRLMIEMDQKKYEGGRWKPPILRAEAVFDKGVAELLEEIDNHARYLAESSGGLHFRRRREKVRQELGEMIKARLVEEVIDKLVQTGEFEAAINSIVEGKTDPYTACDNLIIPMLSL